jgi:hypothetical protein
VEVRTAWVRTLCEQGDNLLAVALFGLAEVGAAVNGKRRGGAMDEATSGAILNDLKADAAAQHTLLDVESICR